MAKRLTPKQKERLLHLANQGLSYRRIAIELGCHTSTVMRFLKALNEKGEPITGGKLTDRPPARRVCDLYPEADQKAFREGTLTPERIAELARTVPTLRALQDFAYWCERYESVKLADHQLAWIEHMLAYMF